MTVAPGEIMLGYIHNGTVRAEFMASVLMVHQSPVARLVGRLAASSGGTLISFARNKLVEEFLKSPCQWLFMIDSDITFSTAQIAQLAADADPHERPVIAAPVGILDQDATGTLPNVFTAVYNSDGVADKFTPVPDLPESGLRQVDACGAAFTMIHRAVLEKIEPGEWFREGITPSGGIRGEDLAFCMRAAEAGFPVWASCGIRPGHMKTVCITAD